MTIDSFEGSQRTDFSAGIERARQLFVKGDAKAAEALLGTLISEGRASLELYLFQVRVLRRLGRDVDALETSKAAAKLFPDDLRAQLGFAEELLSLGRLEEAGETLRHARESFPEEASAHLLYAEACVLGDALEDAEAALSRMQELEGPSARHLPSLVVVQSALGQEIEARKTLRTLVLGAPDQQIGLRLLKITLSRAEKLKERKHALALATAAQNLLKGVPEPTTWRAKYLLDLGQHRAALTALNGISAHTTRNLPTRLAIEIAEIRAIASRELNDHEGINRALEQLAELRPENSLLLENLYLKSLRMGRPEKAKIFEARLQTKRAAKLPASLAEGLNALHAQPPEETPPAIVEWAWSIADQSTWKFEDWKRAADWGKRASILMKQWWMYAPDRSSEIGAFIESPAQGVVDALPQASGCVVVSSHMGPVAAGVHFGVQSSRQFRVYGRPGAGPTSAGGTPVRIGTGQEVTAVIRETLKELDSGAFIGFASDWRDPEGRPFQFLGREILLPVMAPRLAFSRRVPSLWWQSLWKGNRIIMDVARLPDPAEDESFDEWFPRWARVYLERLEKVLRGAPENLNLGDGFWQNVSAEYAQSLRRLPPGSAIAKMRERRAAR